METHNAILWRMGKQARISTYIVIHDMIFNLEENHGIGPTVYLTCGTTAEAARAYAVELTTIDENAGLKLKGHVRQAQVTVDLDALMDTYIGGGRLMGEDLEDMVTVLSSGTVVE